MTKSLAIELIAMGLAETANGEAPPALDDDPELLALVARIKATPPNPNNIIPAQGNLAEVLAAMIHGEPDQDVLDALDDAELELRAINRADDVREGEE